MILSSRPPRDNKLIDALDRKSRIVYNGPSWRAVRDGRDVLLGSRAGGRWDDGTFDVLYTALEADGAVAEIHYHLSRGQPVFPSKAKYRLHELRVTLASAIQFLVVDELAELGVRVEHYGRLSYVQLQQEYVRTQEIAEITHFLGCDGLIVPNARWTCQNLVAFTNRTTPESLAVTIDHGLIDWNTWISRSSSRTRE
jgi:RES domain-containing protein